MQRSVVIRPFRRVADVLISLTADGSIWDLDIQAESASDAKRTPHPFLVDVHDALEHR